MEQATTIMAGGTAVLSGGEGVTASADASGVGVLVRVEWKDAKSRQVAAVGTVPGATRFTGLNRYEPFWMRPRHGTELSAVPPETQVLLVETAGGEVVLIVPLVDGAFRATVQGAEGGIEVVVESGDPAVVTKSSVALFVAAGRDVWALLDQAARAVKAHLGGMCRLRTEKPLPAFADVFGWCTWDAFYREVDAAKVKEGLETFKAGGVSPRMMILDDGWQTYVAGATGQEMLSSFASNEKFGHDLRPIVSMAKGEYGIETFIVWHAMTGYWGGVSPELMAVYNPRLTARGFSESIRKHTPNMNDWWGGVVGLVPPENIYRFFQDYHRGLKAQGVDGVKVDTQATLEGVAAGSGGRVKLMSAYREALEGSVAVHFGGGAAGANLINCMSLSSEMMYGASASTLTRTSTDFWPKRPETHGEHLWINAQAGVWFGQFVWPDWDMFQSGHEMGAYHAAGRAVAGCPVYVSDKPGSQNFEVLRKLVTPDGRALRAKSIGLPTRDCLFYDVTKDAVLLKIWNHNLEAGVLGVFNARYPASGPGGAVNDKPAGDVETAALEPLPPVKGTVSPADVPGLGGERFVLYAHTSGLLREMGHRDKLELTLAQLTYEVFAVTPVDHGVAAVGVVDYFNAGGAITAKGYREARVYAVTVSVGGRFVAWCEMRPDSVEVDGAPVRFKYDEDNGLLETQVSGKAGGTVVICKA